MKHTLFYIFSLLFLSSCLEEYKVVLEQKTEQLAVESLLTNDETQAQVKLSVTEQFGNTNSYKPVRGALITVTDNEGKSTVFQAVASLIGIYRPDANFKAEIGKSYQLTIKLTDGRVYESSKELMQNPIPISGLTAIFEDPFSKGQVGEVGYRIFTDWQDPKNTENYYRWLSWGYYKRKSTGITCSFGSICNDVCWIKNEDYSTNIFSDNGVDGNTIKKKSVYLSPFYYYGKHYVEVKQLHISRNAYQFWRKLKEQYQRSGTIFDPVPAPVTGNIINKNDPTDFALGFFEVASVSKKRIVITGDTLIGKVKYNQLLVPRGDCGLVFPFSSYDSETPPNW